MSLVLRNFKWRLCFCFRVLIHLAFFCSSCTAPCIFWVLATFHVGFPSVCAAAVVFYRVINSGSLLQSLLKLFCSPASILFGSGFLVDSLELFASVGRIWFLVTVMLACCRLCGSVTFLQFCEGTLHFYNHYFCF